MIRTISVITSISLAMFFLVSCANWGGNNPVGVTGGSDQGYGESSDLNLPSSGSESAAELIGTWRHDYGGGNYEIFDFKSNGRYEIYFYENNNYEFGYSGNYTVSGNTITLWVEGQPMMVTYSLKSNRLTLFLEGNPTTYYRV
jgi:hypothetical protein